MAKLRDAAVFLLCALFVSQGGIPCRAAPIVPVRARSRETVLREEREERAEAAARELLGSGTPLARIDRGALRLFTCRNGYALVDPSDGTVVEYALSFPGRNPVFRSAPEDSLPDKLINIHEK